MSLIMTTAGRNRGLTIVELLIVIVVIAILAGLIISGYTGFVKRAEEAKIRADIDALTKLFQGARYLTSGKNVHEITGSVWTGGACTSKPTDTDFSKLDKDTDPCWSRYIESIRNLEEASGLSIGIPIDPWGRPYYLDENENIGMGCVADAVGTFKHPWVKDSTGIENYTYIYESEKCDMDVWG